MPETSVIRRVERFLVAQALEVADPRAARLRTLELLKSVAPFDSAIFLCGPNLGALPVSINKPQVGHFHGQYLARRDHYWTELAPARAVADKHGGVYIDTSVFSANERGRLSFFQEIIRPQGITSQVAMRLEFRGRMVGLIHLCRNARGRGFGQREGDAVMRLLPSVALAHVAASGLSPAEPLQDEAVQLTRRERQIATYVCMGLRTREIAEALGTSPHTVRNQLQHLYQKTGTGGRTELAVLMSRGSARPRASE
jgi:DNA-binding CsgD family transcriptional regulator